MIRTINLTMDVRPDQPLSINIPGDVPAGVANVTVIIAPRERENTNSRTLNELLTSGLIGMWRDRSDIYDSVTYARELRDRAWTRHE